MKRNIIISLLAVAALLSAACQPELQPSDKDSDGAGYVCFCPAIDGGGTVVATRAGEFVSEEGSLVVPFSCEESTGIGDLAGGFEDVQTRGAQVNVSGDWEDLGEYLSSFYVAAWDGSDSFIPAYKSVSKNPGAALWKTADDYIWEEGKDLTFFAHANLPATGASVTCTSVAQQTLSYSVPADATAQNDILLGFYSGGQRYVEPNSIADVKFYHPLTAVRFVVGSIEGASEVNFKSISIEGVYSSGTTALLPSTINATDPGAKFVWNTTGSTKMNAILAAAEGESLAVDGGGIIGEPFIIIPQNLAVDSVKVRVVAEIDGETESLTASIRSGAWEAGKTYTYSFNKVELKLDILDESGNPLTSAVDAHYENAILRFSKIAPTSYSVEVTNPDGTVSSVAADAAWLRFAAPVSATAFASYPGASNSVTIAELMGELMGDGPKTHFIEEDGYYYTQAFIEEYYYAGQSLSSFVGKGNRSVALTIRNSELSSECSATVSQKAMQSPYNLSTASNPFGVEVLEETEVTAGTNSADWCLGRNRDEDGNGAIEGSEIKWRTPSLQEYWNIWYGTYSLSAESWLGLSTSKARSMYLSSDDGYAYNGQVSSTIAGPDGTGTVRCIRDLGTGSNSMYSFSEEDGNINNGDALKKYVLTMSGISSESMRGGVVDELTVGSINPGERTDVEHNKLYSKIQVASQYLTWPTGGTVTVPEILYYLAVDKDRASSYDDYRFDVSYNSSGNITLIDGTVKMINPDPRLVYESKFDGTTGGVSPTSEWSYLDQNGVLHFHAAFTGWSANNSGCVWIINAAVKNADGTTTDLSDGENTCKLVFYVNSGTGKGFNAAWGGTFNVNKVGDVTLIGDNCTALGSSGRYCRLGVLDGGPYTETDVDFPEMKEEFDGETQNVDDKLSADYLCKTYYYEDQRIQGDEKHAALIKGDLGTWRAPSQRELSIMLANRDNLKLLKATESGTGTYVWSEVVWPATDKVFSPRIKYTGPLPYYNDNGILSVGGADTAPYKIRCVRDIE